MKCKIGIITQYHNNQNYGGLLQAYALQKVMSDLGTDCEIIDYDYSINRKEQGNWCIKFLEYLKHDWISAIEIAMFQVASHVNLFFLKKNRTVYLKYKKILKREKCDLFRKKIPHSYKCYNKDSVWELIKIYDLFITGSDQVWNPKSVSEVELLGFVPDSNRKMSYAASIATNIEDYHAQKLFSMYLPFLKSISVREKSSKKIIQQYTNTKIMCNVDPVFLLNSKTWRILSTQIEIGEEYIFAYFLGTARKNRRLLKKIGQLYGKKIVYLMLKENMRDNKYVELGDIQLFDVSPEEFLGLIDRASMIFTDSFHGTAFSIILNKQFVVTARFDKRNKRNTNMRIEDLLEDFNLSERLIRTEKELKMRLKQFIEYENINKKIYEYAGQAKEYLKSGIVYDKG